MNRLLNLKREKLKREVKYLVLFELSLGSHFTRMREKIDATG